MPENKPLRKGEMICPECGKVVYKVAYYEHVMVNHEPKEGK